jgi:hypothetical protein
MRQASATPGVPAAPSDEKPDETSDEMPDETTSVSPLESPTSNGIFLC